MQHSSYPTPLREIPDEDLLEHLRQGNTAAFEEIYQRFWGVLYLHAFRMLAHEQDAQDAVQEVFINLWMKAADIRLTGSLAAYLYTASRNRVLNMLAQKKTYAHHLSSLQHFLSVTDYSSLQQITEKETAVLIEEAIKCLPLKMREIFELSRKTALTHKEIAGQLELSQETVKKQISNAIRVLRRKVAHFFFSLL